MMLIILTNEKKKNLFYLSVIDMIKISYLNLLFFNHEIYFFSNFFKIIFIY